MIYSKYRFTLEIKKTKSQLSIPVLLHDTCWGFLIDLVDDGRPFKINHGNRAVFVDTKPDGTSFPNDCIIEGVNTVRYDFTAQTTSVEGVHNCEIRVYGANGRLLTCPSFTIVVDRRVALDSDLVLPDEHKDSFDAILLREVERINAENARQLAESERIKAENGRKSLYNSQVKDYSVQNKVQGSLLTGEGRGQTPIIQTQESECSVLLEGNFATVEHLKLANDNEYPGKVAIDVGGDTSSQMHTFNDIFIKPNYDLGVRSPRGYYSQYNACWIQGKTGIEIGQKDGSGWTGVLDFNACHFNNSIEAFKVYAKDTNTICLDKCSFEGSVTSIDNAGTVHVRNTYFGDQHTYNGPFADVKDKRLRLLIARPGSKTYFDNSTMSLAVREYDADESLFDLRSDENGVGSTVFVNGGLLNISLNSYYDGVKSTIYASDSPNNLIYIDFATFTPSTINDLHNQIPFYIYDGYSPLRSKFPLRNYVCNGTMKSKLGNDMMLSHSSANGLKFDAAMTNPFGGSVLRANGTARFFYKIPKNLVGKKMTLEFYLYTENPRGLKVNSEGLGVASWNKAMHKYEDERTPFIYRIDVTPTEEAGCIHISNSNDFNVYGVILKEHRYREFLSCYEDCGELYSDETPKTTDSANLGDVVGNVDVTSSGWKFADGKWSPVFDAVTYSLEFSDEMIHLVGTDGSVRFLATTDTEAAEITLNLIGCGITNDNKYTPVSKEYATTITLNQYYGIVDAFVTMDGKDVTSSVFNRETNTIRIPSVNGDIVIVSIGNYEHIVPDLGASSRCSWVFNLGTENIGMGSDNKAFALVSTTPNDFSYTDRHGNTVHPIPVPEGATRVTVKNTDGVVYKYAFIGVKGHSDADRDITMLYSTEYQENNYATFIAGEYDYILISCQRTDGEWVGLETSTAIRTASVTFSKAEEEKKEYELNEENLFASYRCDWAFNLVTENFLIGSQNYGMALCTTASNNFPCTDRHGNTLYPIRIPEGATIVKVAHTDGKTYQHTFIGVKELADGNKDITLIAEKKEQDGLMWNAGEYDYMLISCYPADGTDVPWGFDQTTVSVTFYKV